MAHTLELMVVAEGVETREQLDVLRRTGCDRVQGYYHSRPLPALEFERFMRSFNSGTGKQTVTQIA